MEENEDVPPARQIRQRRIGNEVRRELQRRRYVEQLVNADQNRSSSSGDDSGSSGSEDNQDNQDEANDYEQMEAGEPDFEESDPEESGEDVGENDEADDAGDAHDANDANDANEIDDTAFLREVLRRWAAAGGAASMRKLDELLRNLAVRFEGLPLSYKTLLRTPRRIEVAPLNHGSILWYKGIREILSSMTLDQYLVQYGNVQIDINMDGLPLSRSSALKFWPILGYLVGSENPPFVIGIYLGKVDPDDVYAYLNDLVLELTDLGVNGFTYNDVVYPFSVRNYVLDAPARSLVKCCVLYNSLYSCEKCCVRGEYIDDRMTYCRLDAAPRTDESYNNQDQPEHHLGISPLQEIGTGMVSQFRLDPLHLIYLGVFKRLLQFWLFGRGNFRLHWTVVDAISALLMTLSGTCPSDFNRQIRDFTNFKLFKATEFRRLCHYDSILIFRDYLENNIYRHFLLLYAALYILAHPIMARSQQWRNYAHQLILNFINHSIAIYGEKFVVYNVHSLSHIAKECEDQDCSLTEFSAFKFESFLGSLKKMLKSFYRPCQQVACRITEKLHFLQSVKLPPDNVNVSLSMEYTNNNGILPGHNFRRIEIGKLVLQLNGKDQCFKTRDGDIVLLNDIVQGNDGTVHLIGNRFTQKNDFFDYPLPSSQLGIFSVANPPEEQSNIFEVTDFVVLEFQNPEPGGELEDDIFYDIGLSQWLFDVDLTEKKAQTYWPLNPKNVQRYVNRRQCAEAITWKKFPVKIKRFKGTYEEAQTYLKGVLNHGSSYETETSFGKGQRKKRAKKLTDSESEIPCKRISLKTSSKKVPSPPSLKNIAPPSKIQATNQSAEIKKQKIIVRRHASRVASHAKKTSTSREQLLKEIDLQKSNIKSIATRSEFKPTQESSLQKLAAKSKTGGLGNSSKSSPTPSRSNTAPQKQSSLEKLAAKSKTGVLSDSPASSPTPSSLNSGLKKQSSCEKLTAKSKTGGLPNSVTPLPSSSRLKTGLKAPSSLEKLAANSKSFGSCGMFASSSSTLSKSITQGNDELSTPPGLKKSLEDMTLLEHTPSPRNVGSSIEVSLWQSPSDSPQINYEAEDQQLGSLSPLGSVSVRGIAPISGYTSSLLMKLKNQRRAPERGKSSSEIDEGSEVDDPHPKSVRIQSSVRSNSPSPVNDVRGSPASPSLHKANHENSDSDIDFEIPSDHINTTSPGKISANKEKGSINLNTSKSLLEKLTWLEKDICTLKQEVAYIRADVTEANLNLARLLRFLMPQEKKLKLPPNLPTPTLHVSSLEDFDKMETFLNDKINFDAVVEYLGLLPLGAKEGQAAMTLMAKMMTNGLASCFNYDGNGWKLAFKDTNMWRAVEGALSLHFKGSTLENALIGIRSWLRNAPKRDGGKPRSFFVDKL